MRIKKRDKVSKSEEWRSGFKVFPVLIGGYWYFLCNIERRAIWGVDRETFRGWEYRIKATDQLVKPSMRMKMIYCPNKTHVQIETIDKLDSILHDCNLLSKDRKLKDIAIGYATSERDAGVIIFSEEI